MIEKYKLYTGLLFTALWMVMCWGFVSDELVPALANLRPMMLLFVDAVLVMLGLISLKNKRDIFFLVSLLVILLISAYMNNMGLVSTVNGFRDYLPLVMAPPILRYLLSGHNGERFVDTMDRQLHWFLYAQAVCITFQFIKYGACDMGGGTLGEGGSGAISTVIFAVSFYFLCKNWDVDKTMVSNLYDNMRYVILLYPTLLNETKVSFVFFVFYFMLLFPLNRAYVMKLLLIIPMGLLALSGMVALYVNVVGSDSIFNRESIEEYLYGGGEMQELIENAMKFQDEGLSQEVDNVFMLDLPRFTKVFLVPGMHDKAGGGHFFGVGPSQFKGGSLMEKSEFARKNEWFIKGTVMTFFRAYLELGVIGAIWLILCLGSIVLTPDALPFGKNLNMFMMLMFMVSIIYDSTLTMPGCVFILFYIALTGLQPEVRKLAEGVD